MMDDQVTLQIDSSNAINNNHREKNAIEELQDKLELLMGLKEKKLQEKFQNFKSKFETELSQRQNMEEMTPFVEGTQMRLTYITNTINEFKKVNGNQVDLGEKGSQQKSNQAPITNETLKTFKKKVRFEMDELPTPLRCFRHIFSRNNKFIAETFHNNADNKKIGIGIDWDNRYHLPTFSWTLNEFIRKFTKKEDYLSETFPVQGYPFLVQFKLNFADLNRAQYFANSLVNISLRFLYQNGEKKPFLLNISPRKSFCMRKQDGSQLWRSSGHRMDEHVEYDRWMEVAKFSPQEMFDEVDSSYTFEVNVETLRMAEQVYSYSGRLTWSIEKYSEKKALIEPDHGRWTHESPYFYTDPRGYRVQALIILSHSGHVTMEINRLQGEFDDELPQSLRFKITVTIFNLNKMDRKMTKVKRTDIGNYCSSFIDLGHFKKIEKLIEDDVLMYKVFIETDQKLCKF